MLSKARKVCWLTNRWFRKLSLNGSLFDSTGHISFHKCCRTLHTFKTAYVRDYDFQITGNNLQNQRKSQTISRHTEILKIFDQWSLFDNDCKSSFCISYFMKFGTVNVFQTYSPELSIDFQIPENHLLFELPLC